MSRRLPYFKFYANEWLTGRISAAPLEAQAVFINLAAYSCKLGGPVPDTEYLPRFLRFDEGTFKVGTTYLLDNDILERETVDGNPVFVVKFVAEQLKEMEEFIKKCSIAGKKSASKSRLVQGTYQGTYNEPTKVPTTKKDVRCKMKDIKEIPLRGKESCAFDTAPQEKEPDTKPEPKAKSFKTWTEDEFRQDVAAANGDGLLTAAEVEDFVGYWMEPSASGRPRRAMETTWDTRRRMQTALRVVFARRDQGHPGGGGKRPVNVMASQPSDDDYLAGWTNIQTEGKK